MRIPKELRQDAGIALNEPLDISVSDSAIIPTKSFRQKTLEERLSHFGGNLNFDGEYDWGESVGREEW